MTADAKAGSAVWRWLFNPFHYVAGGQALGVGIGVIVITGLAGAAGKFHFDGVLDFHGPAAAPLWLFVGEGFLDWLAMGAVLLVTGWIVSRSKIRPIDVFGTQALARTPMLIVALVALAPGFRRYTEAITNLTATPGAWVNDPSVLLRPPGATSTDLVTTVVALIVLLVMIVWMVALMYRAYAVSCNVQGVKGALSFIVALIVAEILAKLGIWVLSLVALFPSGNAELGDLDFDPAVKGQALVELLVQGDFEDAVGQFDETMTKVAPAEALRAIWQDLEAKAGPFVEQTGVRVHIRGPHIITSVTCRFERSTYDINVVFDRAGRVSGLRYS